MLSSPHCISCDRIFHSTKHSQVERNKRQALFSGVTITSSTVVIFVSTAFAQKNNGPAMTQMFAPSCVCPHHLPYSPLKNVFVLSPQPLRPLNSPQHSSSLFSQVCIYPNPEWLHTRVARERQKGGGGRKLQAEGCWLKKPWWADIASSFNSGT